MRDIRRDRDNVSPTIARVIIMRYYWADDTRHGTDSNVVPVITFITSRRQLPNNSVRTLDFGLQPARRAAKFPIGNRVTIVTRSSQQTRDFQPPENSRDAVDRSLSIAGAKDSRGIFGFVMRDEGIVLIIIALGSLAPALEVA